MARSDFNWVPINHTFSATAPTVTREFPIEGNLEPIDDGYLLITAYGVSLTSHRIFINNQQLSGVDIRPDSSWQTWMDRIPPGLLKSGMNTIRIDRIGEDIFTVREVVVNWRE